MQRNLVRSLKDSFLIFLCQEKSRLTKILMENVARFFTKIFVGQGKKYKETL